jgi:hypothetical protein
LGKIFFTTREIPRAFPPASRKAFSQKYFLFRLFTSLMGPFFGFSTLTTTHTLTESERRKENFPFAPSFKTFFSSFLFANILVELFLFIYRFFSFSLLPIDIFSNFTLPSFYIFAQVPERAFYSQCLASFFNEKVA